MARLAARLPLRGLERRLARLPPYAALAVLVLPSLLIVPVKILALWMIAKGKALLGVAVIVMAKLAGTALLAWLFQLIQPALLGLAWFARLMPRQNWGIHSYPGAESLIDWMTYEVYQNGEHVSVWDGDKAVRLLSAVGFKNSRVVDMDPAWDLDLPVRTAQSVYIVGER